MIGKVFSEAGIFTWNVGADICYGDSTVASLFGFDREVALSGQRMSAYLNRVHPDDLGNLAMEIHHAITTSDPFHCEYRVLSGLGIFHSVASFGRCFRSADGRDQTQFAGIIYPAALLPLPAH